MIRDEVIIIEQEINYCHILLDLINTQFHIRKEWLKRERPQRLPSGKTIFIEQMVIPEFKDLDFGPRLIVGPIDRDFLTHKRQTIREAIGDIDDMSNKDERALYEKSIRLLERQRMARELPQIKVVVIQEFQGKLRSISVHEAALVQIARTINGIVLPILKGLQTSRDMLSGNTVQITRVAKPNEIIFGYSADLSKATDEMSQTDTNYILKSILQLAGAERRLIEAVDSLTGPQSITHVGDKPLKEPLITTAGAFMGLGPSWTALSILNTYAATRAGIKPASFRICGDDMVALCTKKEALKYENMLKQLTLVPNVEKSFRGDNAVFCEMHMTREEQSFVTGQGSKRKLITLRGEKVVRIAQACGAKVLSKGEESSMRALSEVDQLLDISRGKRPEGYGKTHRVLKRCAYRTSKKLSVGDGGPIYLGGGGRGDTNRRTFNMFVSNGVFKTNRTQMTDKVQNFVDQVRSMTATDTGVRRDDLIAEVKSALSRREQTQGQWVRTKIRPVRTIRRQWNARYCAASRDSAYKKLDSYIASRISDEQITVKAAKHLRKTVQGYLRRGNHKRAILTLQASSNFVSAQGALDLLEQIPSVQGVFSQRVEYAHETLRRQRLGITA
jgi:hypothetical protein